MTNRTVSAVSLVGTVSKVTGVLAYLSAGDSVFLARHTRGPIEGFWNGYGGKFEPSDETLLECLLREVPKESGIFLNDSGAGIFKRAVIDFYNMDLKGNIQLFRVHVYRISYWHGEPQSTEEMVNPTRFPIAALPFNEMMLADRHFLPVLLDGERFTLTVRYGPGNKSLLEPVQPLFVDRLPDF